MFQNMELSGQLSPYGQWMEHDESYYSLTRDGRESIDMLDANLSMHVDNETKHCDPWNPLEAESFVKVIYICLPVVGIFLNIICLPVLMKPEMDNVFNRLLTLLAIFDILNLSSIVGLWMIRSCNQNSSLLLKIFNATATFGGNGSVYTSTVLAVERCVAIYFPFKARDHNLTLSSRRYVFFRYASIAITITIGLTCCSKAYIITDIITFPEDHMIYDIIYYLLTAEIILSFITVILVFATNLRLYVKIKKEIKDTKIIRANSRATKNQISILVVIAFLSLVVHMPFILYLIVQLIPQDLLKCAVKQVLQKILHLIMAGLAILNASCNFFIYNWTGRKFRKNFTKTWVYRKTAATAAFLATVTNKSRTTPSEGEEQRTDSISGSSFLSKTVSENVSENEVIANHLVKMK